MSRKAISIWHALGTPKTKGGQTGPGRSTLHLLPLTAVGGDVITAFINQVSKDDRVEYESAEIDRIDYVGWAWTPEEE